MKKLNPYQIAILVIGFMASSIFVAISRSQHWDNGYLIAATSSPLIAVGLACSPRFCGYKYNYVCIPLLLAGAAINFFAGTKNLLAGLAGNLALVVLTMIPTFTPPSKQK